MRTPKKGRGTFESDKPPVVTLVGRSDGRVQSRVRDDLEDVDEDIAEYGDETVILCTDQYSITTESTSTTRLTGIEPSITTNTTL